MDPQTNVTSSDVQELASEAVGGGMGEANQAAKDKTEKTMKSIQELGKQLEYVTSKCVTVESLFCSELISRRDKMGEHCKNLLLDSPETNGAYARDKLWRFVFYDVVSKAKRLRKKGDWTLIEKAYVKQHILSGIGQLSLLMMKLQEDVPEFMNLKLRIQPNGIDNILPQSMIQRFKIVPAEAKQKWLIDILYIFLLNIGDLWRYLSDLYSKEEEKLFHNYSDQAQDYYTQAFLLNRDSGMAHNQLGNLNLKENGGLDSVYYFLYSLVSKTPCQGALLNLRRLLDTQLVYFARLPASFDWKPVDTFTHHLIGILNQFFGESTHLTKFEKACGDAVGSFIILLKSGVKLLDEGFLFHVMSICIMTVWHLLTQASLNTSSAVCFSIGIFVHLMDRLFQILAEKSKLVEVEDLPAIEECDPPQSSSTPSSLPPDAKDDMASTIEVVVQKDEYFSRRRVLPRRRTRKDDVLAYLCSEEEDDWDNNESDSEGNASSETESSDSSSEEETESDSSDSESESTSDEDKASKNGTSELSDLSYQADVDLDRKAAELKLSQSSDDATTDKSKGKNDKLKMKKVLDLIGLEECWSEIEPILVAVLPFMRWLKCYVPVRNAFAATTEKEVLDRFCQLLNMLESTNWSVALKHNWNNKSNLDYESKNLANEVEAKLIKDWKNVVDGKLNTNPFLLELPEDVVMAGWPLFEPVMKDIESKPLTKNNEIVTRIGRIFEFGQWLVGTEEFAVIRSDKTFLVPSVEEYKKHMRKLQLEKFNRRLSKSKEAKLLGLDDETVFAKNRRRRRNQAIRRSTYDERVYLVFDLPAVLKYLRIIQKLALQKRFVLVFPYSVTRALDDMKDNHEEGCKIARILNRWLERYLSKANIRLMAKHEKLPINSTDYPRIHTKESLEFYDTLETCNYIRHGETKNKTNGRYFKDARDSYRVIYLTGNKSLLDSGVEMVRDFKPIASCKSNHVFLDRITRYQNRRRNQGMRNNNGQSGG